MQAHVKYELRCSIFAVEGGQQADRFSVCGVMHTTSRQQGDLMCEMHLDQEQLAKPFREKKYLEW